MESRDNITPAKLKANIELYWALLEDWIRRRWLGLLAMFILVWMVTHKDITISFSMQKGDDKGGGLFSTVTQSLFYNPFEGEEETAQNVATRSARVWDDLTPAEREKRNKQLAYVKAYHHLANEEMKKRGIPASITLAQGLLESNIGESRLATENNNHFGIKCFSKTCPKGHCSNFNDDHHKDFFRKFKSVAESYGAHSQVLEKGRYRSLFKLASNDYRGWAHGLKKAGYATDPRYGEKLVRIIEDLELYQYDI